MNQAALPRKCKSMVSSTMLFFVFFQGIECGSAIYCQTHIEIKTSFYKWWALRVGGGSYTDSLGRYFHEGGGCYGTHHFHVPIPYHPFANYADHLRPARHYHEINYWGNSFGEQSSKAKPRLHQSRQPRFFCISTGIACWNRLVAKETCRPCRPIDYNGQPYCE